VNSSYFEVDLQSNKQKMLALSIKNSTAGRRRQVKCPDLTSPHSTAVDLLGSIPRSICGVRPNI